MDTARVGRGPGRVEGGPSRGGVKQGQRSAEGGEFQAGKASRERREGYRQGSPDRKCWQLDLDLE